MDLYNEVLSKKYQLFETTDDFGFKIYGGGVSPLWDGSWFDYVSNLSDGKYSTAIHTDVIEYDDDLVSEYGYKYKYGVRIVYAPFEYVKEEF